MASKSPDEVADEDIIEEPDVSEQPDTPAVDDNRGIEQQGPLAALSAASGSSSAVAISIELPAVNQLDEKIKQLQKDREALKTQRKQVARELKAKKKQAVKKARATRHISDEVLMDEVRRRLLKRPAALAGPAEAEEAPAERLYISD